MMRMQALQPAPYPFAKGYSTTERMPFMPFAGGEKAAGGLPSVIARTMLQQQAQAPAPASAAASPMQSIGSIFSSFTPRYAPGATQSKMPKV